MTPGRKVFIPNVVRLDYTDAKRFGELVALSRGGIDMMDVTTLQEVIEAKLVEADVHAEDYVLLSGAPLLNTIVTNYFVNRYAHVRCLQWDGILQEYKLIEHKYPTC